MEVDLGCKKEWSIAMTTPSSDKGEQKFSFQTFPRYIVNYSVVNQLNLGFMTITTYGINCLCSFAAGCVGTILSKLPPKETARTSVLSSKWKHIWTVCPKLRFDGVTMCGEDVPGTQHYTQKFVGNVSEVLKQYHGKIVEEFEVKFEFDSTLAQHLDDWVNFALSSRAKTLALDLLPAKWGLRPDRYRFPFELFDDESISRLQRMQLSCVSLESPSKSIGFRNLKKLDLHVLNVTRKDLQDMLSNCSNLQWLSIVRCHLGDELKVGHPLPCLLYLHVAYCEISRIELNATNLRTFVYRGAWIPFYLGHALALKEVKLYWFGKITL